MVDKLSKSQCIQINKQKIVFSFFKAEICLFINSVVRVEQILSPHKATQNCTPSQIS